MGPKPRPITQRFWAKVNKDGPVILPGLGPCWVWTGVTSRGYGKFRVNQPRRVVGAHRISWEFANGPVPDGLFVLHHCDNRLCINPAHLFLGTQADNMRDMVAKGRNRQVAPAQPSPEQRARGEAQGSAKLTASAVREMRTRHAAGEPITHLAIRFRIGATTVRKAIRRQTWAHVN